MCLRVDSLFNHAELVAKEDIPVWKVLGPNNISLHREFKYKPHTLYRLRKKMKVEFGGIYQGYHSYDVIPRYIPKYGRLVKMIIPKGAKYYEGKHSDWESGYVSSSIRTGDLRDQKGKHKSH